MWWQGVCSLLLGVALAATSCADLSDEGAMQEVVPGTWAFSYEVSEDLGYELLYERVVFNTDGTCRIEYPDGYMSGTYRAGDALISITYQDADDPSSEPVVMLWRVRSFSQEQIIADIDFDNAGHTVTAVVTLDRITN